MCAWMDAQTLRHAYFFASFGEKKIILVLGEMGKALPGKSGTKDQKEAGTIPALSVMEQKKKHSGSTLTSIVTSMKFSLYSKPCLQKGTKSDHDQ